MPRVFRPTIRFPVYWLLGALTQGYVLPATAAESATSDDSLEQVTVTARKRGTAESLQDIAASVQALGGEDLERRESQGLNDYMRLIPSLNYQDKGPGQAQLGMRGANATRLNHANPNTYETVAVYLENVPVTTSGFNPDAGLVDVDRIEVLRGPQGTLYGSSAMTGAIRIIPRAPRLGETGGETGFSIMNLEHGSPSGSAYAVVNLPIHDTVAVRLVGYATENGGYIDNVFTGEKAYNYGHNIGGRLAALWRPNERFTAKATLTYQDSFSHGRPDMYLPGDPAVGVGLNSHGSLVATPFESPAQWKITGDLQTAKVINDVFPDRFYIGAIDWTYDFDPVSLTSTTSYMDRHFLNRLDDAPRVRDVFISLNRTYGHDEGPFAGSPAIIPVAPVFDNDNTTRQITQELRLTPRGQNRFSWLLGAYFEDVKRDMQQTFMVPGLGAWSINAFGTADFGQRGGDDNSFDGVYQLDTKQEALFGEARYRFGPEQRGEVSLGARAFRFRQQAFISFKGFLQGNPGVENSDTSDHGINPRAEVSYRATDNVMAYANAAKGFRLGSVQQPLPDDPNDSLGCRADLRANGLTTVPNNVKSDSLWNYEVGMKTTWVDNRVRANVDAYYIDWKNPRVQTFLSCGYIFEFTQGKIESHGVEFELAARVLRPLTVSLSGAYNHSELTQGAPAIGAKSGDQTPFSPRWTLSGGFELAVPTARGYMPFLSADASYVSEQFADFTSLTFTAVRIPPSTDINMQAGLRTDRWTAALFVKNLTDAKIFTSGDRDRRQPAHLARALPRVMGISVRFSF